MARGGARLTERLADAAADARLSDRAVAVIVWSPVVLVTATAVALILPVTRGGAMWLLEETHPVERGTALALLVAGIVSFVLARRTSAAGASRWVVGWWVLVGVLGVLGALEEVAWGQWLFGIEGPEAVRDLNVKNELTIHNLPGLDGNTESLRLVIGSGGLVALLLHPVGRRLGAIRPSDLLLPWFAVIAAHSVPDLISDLAELPLVLADGIDWLSELVEFLIGVAALLYVAIAARVAAGIPYRPDGVRTRQETQT